MCEERERGKVCLGMLDFEERWRGWVWCWLGSGGFLWAKAVGRFGERLDKPGESRTEI